MTHTPAARAERKSASKALALSALKSSVKRSRVLKRRTEHISTASLKKLARKAGVIRIKRGMLDTGSEVRAALLRFLQEAVRSAVILAEHARRCTITANDMVLALKRQGVTVYGMGDWTNGFYARRWTRDRLKRAAAGPRATAAEVAEAAASRAARSAAGPDAVISGEEVEQRAAGERAGEAAAGAPQQEQWQEAAAALRTPALEALAPAEAGPAAQQAEQPPAAAKENCQPQQAEQPQQQFPAADKAPTPAAQAPVQPAFAVHTPAAQPMSVERCAELQAALAAVLSGPLVHDAGVVTRGALFSQLCRQLRCTRDEFDDLLYVLEKREAIMFDPQSPDDVYVCA